MPERNFEQQARDMANGFNMEPKPEVWQNVRNAIQQPQRKRKFVLWWWILPLALVGGAIAFYTLSEQKSEMQVANTNTVQQTNPDKKATTNDEQLTQQDNSKNESPAADSSTLIIAQKSNSKDYSSTVKDHAAPPITLNNSAELKKANNQISNGGVAGNKESVQNAIKEVITKTDATNSQKVTANNEGTQQNDSAFHSLSPTVINEDKRTNDSTVSVDILQTSPVKNSPSPLLLAKDSALSETASKSSLTNIVKPKKRTALQWGLVAEGGVAARKSSLFSVTSLEKSLDGRPSPQNLYDFSSGSFGLNSSSGFSFSNDIKHGAAISLGVALQKKLNRSTDAFADITYSYQSYKISSTAYKDSLLLNYSLTTLIGSYQATQSFYFTSVFAGINWHFINTRKLQFGISAGTDNLLLLAARQKINNVSNSSLSVERMQGLSDSFFTKTNFYKYQPSLFAGVIVNVKTGRRQLQFVPFARSSFRTFDKTTRSNNNHLFSAGLRAVYFFR